MTATPAPPAGRGDRVTRRVVVTGIGAVSPFGVGAAPTCDGAFAGRPAIRRIERFDPSGFPTTFAAEAPDVDPEPFLEGPHRRFRKLVDRKTAWALSAAAEACAQAGWAVGSGAGAPERFGVAVGSEAGRQDLVRVARDYLRFRADPDLGAAYEALDPLELVKTTPNLVASLLAAVHDARGPNLTVSTACTSSAQSVGEAVLRIRRGEADAMLAGGADCLVDPFMLAGFSLLGALSTRNDDPAAASRPFDKDRDGFVLGEGAGFLVLEEEGRALARGARPLCELAGYAASLSAYRITDSPPDGAGAYEAMGLALLDAGVAPAEVDYVNAHGTSTAMNDASEAAAVRRLFGRRCPPVSSTKSTMGHLVAACGAVEAIVCVDAIRRGLLPPTANYTTPDPACDVDPVPREARAADVRVAISNSFGFGGSNGTLVFRRWEGPGGPRAAA